MIKISLNNLKKSIIGGGCISLGAFAYLITLQKTNNPFIASAMFYLGLSLILVFQQNLFTGQVYTKSDLKPMDYTVTLISTWTGNFIGSIITTVLLYQIIQPNVSKIIATKMSLNPIQLIISAFFCNILVCCAVANYKETKNHLISGFFICAFVICGFEHCIADMIYIVLGTLQGLNINTTNDVIILVFSTIGNVLGGLLVVNIKKQNN